MSSNLSELSGRKGLENNLFEKIGRLANSEGSPSAEALENLADEFLIGKANTYGAATFYDFTRPENRGKQIYVCNGSACLCAGTQEHVHHKMLSKFKPAEIGEMCCLGRCHENAAFHYKGVNYSGASIEQLDSIVDNTSSIPVNEPYSTLCLGTPVLMRADLEITESLIQKLLSQPRETLLEQVRISGLRGRGGAGFPMAVKLEACQKTDSDQRYVVCNADEGDPGAYSDRYLLEQKPLTLIFGMMIAAYLCEATQGVIYIRAEYPESVSTHENWVNTLRSQGLLGENLLDSGFSFDLKIIKAQGAYICGEETALLSSIEGQRPEVRVRPPYPAQQGLFNKPTVVNNVETLACLPFILEMGGNAFASIGKGRSKGTKLVSLDSHFKRPGIYEVDMGTPLSRVVQEAGQGFKVSVKAMHIGGPLGGLVPIEMIEHLTMDFESFQTNGFLLGHASIVCIPDDFPLIDYMEHLFRFTAHESCGKCFPCRLGSTRGYELIENARQTGKPISRQLFHDLLETLEIGSLCALGGGLPLPIRNALHYFGPELKDWISNHDD